MPVDRDRIMQRLVSVLKFTKLGTVPDLDEYFFEDIEKLVLDLEARNHELRGMFSHVSEKYLKMTDKNREEERAEGKGP